MLKLLALDALGLGDGGEVALGELAVLGAQHGGEVAPAIGPTMGMIDVVVPFELGQHFVGCFAVPPPMADCSPLRQLIECGGQFFLHGNVGALHLCGFLIRRKNSCAP